MVFSRENKNVSLFVLAVFMLVCFFSTGIYSAQAQTEGSKSIDPNDPNSLIYLGTFGQRAGTGDVKKSGKASVFAKLGEGWHPNALAVTNLPMDKYGLVDWVKIITEERIDPRYSLDPAADPEDEALIDMNILFETKSDFIDDVIFPHDIHTYWLKCEICHDSVGGPIFNPEAGSNKVLMTDIAQGKWCGRCHDKVAFPLTDCKRCHRRAKGLPEDDDLTYREAEY